MFGISLARHLLPGFVAALGLGVPLQNPSPASAGLKGITQAELRGLLLAIPVPGSGSPEYFVPPSPAETVLFGQAVDAAWQGNASAAAQAAGGVGYELLTLHVSPPGDDILILKERAEPGDADYRALGFYVFRPAATRRLILQAPHPRYDLDTLNEAVEGFLHLRAAALFVSGVHRNNSSTSSPCTNGGYYISDAAHWDGHFFHAAHVALVNREPAAIAVQFHGYGNPSGEQFILSEGFAAPPSPTSFVARLEYFLEQGQGYVADMYPTETTRLGGTWNTQGRYSNGEWLNPCGTAANASAGTFVHLEQVRSVRQHPRGVLQALDDVAREFW